MADYYPLLSRAVAALPDSTPEARTAIYDRARKALLGQLQNIQPPLAQADIDREVQALDAAVARIEAEATGQPVPEPAPAPAPASAETPEPSEPAASPATAASSPPAEPAQPPEKPSEPAAPVADSPDTQPEKPAEEPAAGETSTPASPVRPVLPPAPEPKRPSAPIAPPSAAPADAAGGAGTDTPPEAAAAGAGMMAAGTAVAPPSPAAPARRAGEADHSPSPELAAAPDDRGPSARPRAPRPRKKGGSRIGYIVAALLFIAASGVAGFFAWSSRISPQEIQTTKIASPKPGAAAPAAASDPGKIGERAAGGEEPSAGAPDAGTPSTPPSAPDSPASGSQGDTPSAGAPVAQASPDKPAGDPPASPSANPPADTPSDKPANPPADPAADPPADQPADKPASGDAGTPPAGAAPAQSGQNGANANNAGVPVAQRAAILVQAPTKENAQAVKTLTGVVVWRQDNVHRGSDQPLSLAIRADVEIPEAKFRAIMTIEKNLDPTLPASHTITWRFQASGDGTVPGIDQIDAPQMRDLDRPQPSPLLGANAKITNSIFITALAASNQLRKTNLDNLKERGWIDLPLKLTNGRIAKLTLEKGNPGDKVFEEVMKKWSE